MGHEIQEKAWSEVLEHIHSSSLCARHVLIQFKIVYCILYIILKCLRFMEMFPQCVIGVNSLLRPLTFNVLALFIIIQLLDGSLWHLIRIKLGENRDRHSYCIVWGWQLQAYSITLAVYTKDWWCFKWS